ncbi:MAG: hypothetical protein IJR16_02505 [Spirochaetales bacterium]|nr:hypothetical protein [Spirochaetales bacterium]
MQYSIENRYLSCMIDSCGAQLMSLKALETGRDYIWNGNPEVWKWHAPVLFPFCGNFPEGFEHNGKTCHLPMHGFLRDVEHSHVSAGHFLFESEGFDGYPFAFSARTSFILEGTSLTHRIEIENRGSEDLPFSLGFHTGFALSNAKLEFEIKEEELGDKVFIADDDSLSSTRFLTHVKSGFITCADKRGKSIRWESSGYSTLVLWTMPGHSRDFICIEPRIDTVPEGAKEPFKCFLQPGKTTVLEERITVLS